jgi:hypothetical protein
LAVNAVFRSQSTLMESTSEHYIYDNTRSVELSGGPEWDSIAGKDPKELDRETAHYAVRALTTLCEDLIIPISFGVRTCWGEGELGATTTNWPPRWNWFAKTPPPPSDVNSSWRDPQVIETATLDQEAMLSVVDRALDDSAPAAEDSRLVWDMLYVEHTWARLPEPERHIRDNELRIIDWDCSGNCVSVPLKRVHGHTWATLPEHSLYYPFELRVEKIAGLSYPLGPEYGVSRYGVDISISVNVCWSFWWEPGEGRAMLDRAVDRLLQQGWHQTWPASEADAQ